MSHVIEKSWNTKAGYVAQAWFIRHAHRTGYVRIPEGHPCHGVRYQDNNPALTSAWEKAKAGTIGKRGPIPVFCAALDGTTISADVVFDVHGSITYSGDLNDDGQWWYGFDCGHDVDKTAWGDGEERSLEYVVEECESLARQLAEVAGEKT